MAHLDYPKGISEIAANRDVHRYDESSYKD